MKVTLSYFLGFLTAAFIGYLILEGSLQSKPGVAPTDVFLDQAADDEEAKEWYSQDGCWHLQNGYWRPLRRCHIVRVPTDSKLIEDAK